MKKYKFEVTFCVEDKVKIRGFMKMLKDDVPYIIIEAATSKNAVSEAICSNATLLEEVDYKDLTDNPSDEDYDNWFNRAKKELKKK